MLESMMVVAEMPRQLGRISPADEKLRFARTCYDHLAGHLAVSLAEGLVEAGHLSLSDGRWRVDREWPALFRAARHQSRYQRGRPFCRLCLDWSERRHLIAGTLGTQIKDHCLEAGWITHDPAGRTVNVTSLQESGSFVTSSVSISDQGGPIKVY